MPTYIDDSTGLAYYYGMAMTHLSVTVSNPADKKNGHKGHAPVIFGEEGDSNLIGATSLEAMGMVLDPLKRKLTPLPMVLG